MTQELNKVLERLKKEATEALSDELYYPGLVEDLLLLLKFVESLEDASSGHATAKRVSLKLGEGR